MISAVISQWESAHRTALELVGKLAGQTHEALNAAGVLPTADTWTTLTKTALHTSRNYASACQSALDEGWRKERDKLNLKNSASSIKELAEIHADLATRLAHGHAQHAGALASAAAQYLEDLSRCRDAQDATMAWRKLAGDLHNQTSAYAAHLSSLAVGVPAALVQWAESHFEDDDEKTPSPQG